MSKPTIHGFPQSTYVWTARAALQIKGVDHEFVAITPGEHKQDAHRKRHPYAKVPSFRHGDLELYETAAITRYIDEAFDGPALQPADAVGRAQMQRWISVVNCYAYSLVVGRLLFGGYRADGGPNAEVIEAAAAEIRHTAALWNEAIGDGTFLVGDRLSLADLFIGPLVFLLSQLPAGQAILADNPGLQRLQGALAETPGFITAAPPKG